MGGESKGLAGGNITNINTNMKNIRGGASALSKVATVLTFDDILNEEPKVKSNNAASLRITGPEKQPKRGQTQQLNKKSSSSSGIFDQSLSSGPKNNSNKNKNSNVTYRSTILGQAIGKLLDNKSKITNNSSSGSKFGNIVKSKSLETVEVIKTSTKNSLKRSESNDSDVDADVEDELSESDLTVISKPKLVQHRKSTSISSPEKGLLKSSHSDLKSGIDQNNLSRTYRRAAASKASDRINRESRGRLSLSSSSSDDSRISDPEEDINKSKQNIVNKVNNVRSPTVLPSGGGGPKTGLEVEKIIKTSTSDISKKLVKSSSDVDSDFKTKKAPTSETPTPTTVIPSEREINCKPATPPIVASSTPAMGHGGSSGSGQDLNPRPSTSVVKIALKRKTQSTLDSSLEKLEKPKKPKIDSLEEKENPKVAPGRGNNVKPATPTSTVTSSVTPLTTPSLKPMSWPEQLARNKAARSTMPSTTTTASNSTNSKPTTGQRHSIDSMDSMEMELAGSETVENGKDSNPVPPLKKAIILPILGKKKNSLVPQTATTTTTP